MANFPTNAATGSIFSTGTNVYRYVGHNQWETISPNIAVGYSEMDQSITGSIETFENTGASAPSTLSVNTLQLDGAHDTSNSSAFSVVGSSTKLSSETQQLGNLVLHLQMEGSNNSTTFTDSSKSAHTATSAGGAKISTDKRIIGTSSAYFDGTDDSITVADHHDLDLEDGSFTIEFWMNRTDTNSNNGILFKGNRSSGTAGFGWLLGDDNFGWFYYGNGSITYKDFSSITCENGVWQHVAMVYDGSSLKLYVNGVLKKTESVSDIDTGNVSQDLEIGNATNYGSGSWQNNNFYFSGYIDDLKIFKGFAKYTSAFSVDNRPDHALPTDAPELKIQSKYNNVLTSYKINMTRDKE